MLKTNVSLFKSTKETAVEKIISIGAILERIKNGTYKTTVDEIRSGNSDLKKQLPMVSMHGLFNGFRRKDDFAEASGLIILDIDDISADDDLEEIKRDIMDSSDHVFCAMISPSGDGIKVLYYVLPDLVNVNSYRQIGKQIVQEFSIYGKVDYLSITDCLIMTYDPNILVNSEAEPAFIYVKEVDTKIAELEPLDPDRKLWEDPEDFFDTVFANDIAAKTNNNFHFIQVSILDLAKFGFYHPQHDLSFVVDYAEENFGASSKNKQRFLDVAELAKSYPQSKWPYKMIRNEDDEEDDDYMDYSDYKPSPKHSKETDSSASDEPKTDYFINYNTLWENVLEVIKEGDRVGYECSLKNFADIFRLKGSGILTVTGIPSHGKTEFVDEIIVDMARLYEQETVIAGFEQTPPEHLIKLMRRGIGVDITCPSYFNEKNQPTIKKAYEYLTSRIFHIDTNKTGGNINTILEAAAEKIKERRDAGGNPKYVVIDPFNMLSIKGKFSGHEKIEEILRRITHFSHQMEVLVILVAHPFKMRKDEKTGTYEVPDFYSVKGSSAFFEMSYHGWVVYRTGYEAESPVFVRVLKVKQNNLGKTGEQANFIYHRASGRYIPIDEECNEMAGDHRDGNWLENK